MVVMGLFGSLKKKLGRDDDNDYTEIRSHVIGERPPAEMEFQERKFGPQPPQEFNDDPFRPEPMRPEPFSAREPVSFEQPRKDYDIMDKLSMIEVQLSAIRSQTETINERLKNLEMKLSSRRY